MYTSINHNLMAANTARNLNSHYANLATSTQRLSSGLRINGAADDAAGLAIRELMRADVAALHQGVRNANDAISMIQVADGALGIIDEKLIRMKELAEQAATGTYDSTQRLMIDSEFQAMAAEIDRIANATDFNGIKLLDGSLSGAHDGSKLKATGAMKIHFGSANDSAEDYYYVEIGDCTLAGLGLREPVDRKSENDPRNHDTVGAFLGKRATPNLILGEGPAPNLPLNDLVRQVPVNFGIVHMPQNGLDTMQHMLPQGIWVQGQERLGNHTVITNNFMFLIPKGTKNIVVNSNGRATDITDNEGHNDIQLITATGVHLAGTPFDDYSWNYTETGIPPAALAWHQNRLPFNATSDYTDEFLNTGPTSYDPVNKTLGYSTYNGMTIGFSGDPDRHDAIPNDGLAQTYADYEILTIDEAKEDLVLCLPGARCGFIKAYWDVDPGIFQTPTFPDPPETPNPPEHIDPVVPPGSNTESIATQGKTISIGTQAKAQQALVKIDEAIVKKDKIRAHLGAMQNRLENTVSNLTIQAENLQASESRISDVDVATEMTNFVRNQILTQSAVAMLSQANSMPQMAMRLISGG